MLKWIEEFGKCVEIAGFRGVKIGAVEMFLSVVNREKSADVNVQFFDVGLVATWEHLYFAVLNALTAFKGGENVSRSLAMETLLYASAERQISRGMERVGIKPSTAGIAVLIIGERSGVVDSALSNISKCMDGQHDDSVLELSWEKAKAIKKAFGISAAELETGLGKDGLERALVDLVIERMALLSTQR